MRKADPRHRYRAAREKASASPTVSLEAALTAALDQPKPDAAASVRAALDVWENTQHRGIVDSVLLAGATDVQVAELLEMTEEDVATYRYLFFDTAVFRNKLEKMTFAANYRDDAWASDFVRAGLAHGLNYLLWSFGGKAELSTRNVVRTSMEDAHFKARAHKGTSLTSKTAREASRWMTLATQYAKLVEDLDPQRAQQAHEALRIILEKKDDTVAAAQAAEVLDTLLR